MLDSRLGTGLSPRRSARLVLAVSFALGMLVVSLLPASAAQGGFDFSGRPTRPLANPKTWILQGEKLSTGACRYRYPSSDAVIPALGWELRSIGIDMATCRKLMEEGTPQGFAADPSMASLTETATGTASSGINITTATQGAWQRSIWRDLGGVLVNADLTQINWTYNGSTVSGGSTTGGWSWNTATGWTLGAHTVSQLYGSGSSSYRGQTTATFINSYFCNQPGAKTVYTYYYWNRVWGFPNGTATRSESSDTVDECLPLHNDIQSAYGQWPG